jgi:hypothetical protein
MIIYISMNVYSYFESVDGLPLNNHMVKMWVESWSKQGWNPIVLGESDAKTHPLYEKFSNALKTFPSVNTPGFDYHAFMRWLAVPAVGGYVSTEPDVINYSLTPDMVKEWIALSDENQILQCHSPVPAFLCGTPSSYETICKQIINHTVTPEDSVYGRPHLSDQDFAARYCDGTTVNFYRDSTLCAELFDGDKWNTSPCVHFGTPYMMSRGLLPKHVHIPQLRA